MFDKLRIYLELPLLNHCGHQSIKSFGVWETALARAVRSAGAVHALRNLCYTVSTLRRTVELLFVNGYHVPFLKKIIFAENYLETVCNFIFEAIMDYLWLRVDYDECNSC